MKDRFKRFFNKILKKEKESREMLNSNQYKGSNEKTTVNKRSLVVLVFLIALFLFLVVYLVIFQLFYSDDLVNHNHNKRNWIDENVIARGTIYDRNGNVVVHTEKDEEDNNYRVYDYGESMAPVTGYNSVIYGKSGIENTYNNDLLNISTNEISKLKSMVIESGIGNDVTLSIDANLQELSYRYLDGIVGSIVIMNAETGEVLSLVSNPSFDPNSIDMDWEELIQDEKGPLLNRATQGVYRPGSIMKVITATGLLDNNVNLNYNDTGKEVIQNYTVTNFGDAVFGQLDLRSAIVNSVNTYFANKTVELGKKSLEETTDKFMFNEDYKFDLVHNRAEIPYDELNEIDTAMTGFGYGKTTVTPLHMAMVASTIANGGKMMQPRLVLNVKDKDGKILKTSKEEVLSEVTTADTANKIKDAMIGVVNEGSGQAAYNPYLTIAGKTGTADTENDSTDAWFIGFAVDRQTTLAIAVVVENDGRTGGEVAAPIAGPLLRDAYDIIE